VEEYGRRKENAKLAISRSCFPFDNYIRKLTDADLYGSSESTRVDGTAMSSFVSWDSKITTVNALLGGVSDLVRQKMKTDGIYDDFISVTQVRSDALEPRTASIKSLWLTYFKREYGAVFENLKGEDISLCLPSKRVPDEGLVDYTQCQ
jgi:hypothetical protein